MKKLLVCLTAFGAISITAATAGTITTLVSDTFPSNFNNFSGQSGNPTPPASLQWSASPGVGGVSGRIDAITGGLNHTASTFYTGSGGEITWEPGVIYGTSIFFLTGTTSTDISQVQTGFARNIFSDFGASGSSVSGQLRNDGNGAYLRLFQQGSQVGGNSGLFSLSNAEWYELETRMTLSTATLGDISVHLYSRGADGTAERSLVQAHQVGGVTIGNNGFNGPIFVAGFGGGNNSGANIAAFDNFSITVIPEPRVYAALAGLFALGLVLIRRRRRN